ncbi:MAG: D-2-hydroxyacid dehydrogenase [Prevotella sp.]|nr:D-2-hydroxyacid dehydrogenase [Prevotella sp.]
MRIVILDGYSVNPGDLSWDALREMGDVEVYDRTSPEEVVTRAEKAEIVLTNKVVLDKSALDRLPSLRYIGVLATGYNVVNLEETRQRGIIVTNIPAYSTDSVAQMTFAHILNITNRVGHYAQENAHGRWSNNADFCYWDSPLHELAGKTLGIVGLGNIGKRVARIAADFGMDVFALTSKEPSALPHGVQKTTMEGLLAVSDILTLHCPLTESTRHLIRAETIQKMKHGTIIINTGRGPLVNEHDVAKALHDGHLAAYGADVLDTEPPTCDNELLSAPNAFITPHIAWATVEARKRLIRIATENVQAYLSGTPRNIV